MKLRLATRRSPLALVQSRWVAARLQEAEPGLEVELVEMTTRGDELKDVSLTELGGKMQSGNTSTHSGNTFTGNYQLSVTLDRFGDMVSAIESAGRVAERQVKDYQPTDAGEAWAVKVNCPLSLSTLAKVHSRWMSFPSLRREIMVPVQVPAIILAR